MQAIAVILLSLIWLNPAFASAGKLLFVSGPVTIERAATVAAKAGDVVEQGDVIATGEKARAQLLMNDGARIALRSGSRFRIDEFSLPAAVAAPVQASTANAEGKAVSSLLKGGFRTTTGAIGKSDPAGYAVRTPVGTLGIRGTGYVAVWCMGDCIDVPGLQPGDVVRDGLYLAVEEGVVVFQYGSQEIRLTAGQVIFIPAGGGDPESLDKQPSWLSADGAGSFRLAGSGGSQKASDAKLSGLDERRTPASPEPGTSDGASDGTAIPGNENGGVDQQIIGTGPNGGTIDLTPGGPGQPQSAERRDLSWSVASLPGAPEGFVSLEDLAATGYTLDAGGNLIGFDGVSPAGPANFDIGTASVVNAGGSAAAVVRWGRWSGGNMVVTASGVPALVALDSQSLHWILSDNADVLPVIPITGNVSYTLAGGTNPTDGAGSVGTLGSATFTADFTSIEVATTLDLNVAGNAWSASGTGAIGTQVSPTTPANHFTGSYDTIQINALPTPATGEFRGFFSGPPTGPDGAPAGAGLSFNLIDVQTGLQVNGSAAFIAP